MVGGEDAVAVAVGGRGCRNATAAGYMGSPFAGLCGIRFPSHSVSVP